LLAEFLIVALGVLAALAADNWNGFPQGSGTSSAPFLRPALPPDMEQNIQSLDRSIGEAEVNKEALQRVIRGIESGESQWQTPDDFIRDLIRCTYSESATVVGSPSMSCAARGSLRLIRDDVFKRQAE